MRAKFLWKRRESCDSWLNIVSGFANDARSMLFRVPKKKDLALAKVRFKGELRNIRPETLLFSTGWSWWLNTLVGLTYICYIWNVPPSSRELPKSKSTNQGPQAPWSPCVFAWLTGSSTCWPTCSTWTRTAWSRGRRWRGRRRWRRPRGGGEGKGWRWCTELSQSPSLRSSSSKIVISPSPASLLYLGNHRIRFEKTSSIHSSKTDSLLGLREHAWKAIFLP